MSLFTDRDSFDYEKFPEFSRRKNAFINTEKGVSEMCEKIETMFKSYLEEQLQQSRLNDLFGFVARGGMTLDFAANEAKLSPSEFETQMHQNGYVIPQTGAAAKAGA